MKRILLLLPIIISLIAPAMVQQRMINNRPAHAKTVTKQEATERLQQLLVSFGAIDATDGQHKSIRDQKFEEIKKLIAAGADPNTNDNRTSQYTALTLGIYYDRYDVIIFLMDHGIDVNRPILS